MAFRLDRRSLRWKLPWLFAGSAALTVVAFGVIAYAAARNLAVDTAAARLESALSQIRTVIELGVVNQLNSLRSAAANPGIIDALRQPGRTVPESAQQVLRELKGVSDSLVVVELVDAGGVVIHSIPDSTRGLALPDSDPVLPEASIGPLIRADSLVYFRSSVAVTHAGRVIGEIHVSRPHRNALNRRMAAQFVEGADVLIGNLRDGVLLKGGGVEYPSDPGAPMVRYRRDGETWISVSGPIRGTPWLYAVEVPERIALAPANRLLIPVGLAGILIAMAGALIGASISTRITTPLSALTAATEAIARGETDVTLAGTERADEIGRLARAFATMAESVTAARSSLEGEVHARTGELVTASSRLRQLHEELRESERFAMLGRLSGSVGHELRNPLGVMSNVVFLIDALPDASDTLKEYAGLLREQLRVSERIITDLLDRARTGSAIRTPVDISQLLDATIARAAIPAHIRVERLESQFLPIMMLDRDHVTQVLWNIVNNAVQAMHAEPGVLTVATAWADGHLSIEVRDTGAGVPEADHERIFAPMFTTKEHGVGLGLSVSRAFARADGGDLYVRATSRGACFVLNLPAPEAVVLADRLPSPEAGPRSVTPGAASSAPVPPPA